MGNINRIILVVTMLMMSMMTVGCWNYEEINDKGIITGVAIDYEKESDLIIETIEIVTPKMEAGEATIDSQIVDGKGENFFDAARNLIARTGRKLFWGHTKILIISEEVAGNDEMLISTLDFLKRDAEPRDDMWILLSREKTAKEIFEKTNIELENIIAFYLDDMLKNEKSASKYHAVPLWKFIDDLSSKGISPTLPTVKLAHYKEKTTSEIYGTGVFKGEKLVGWLDGIETRSYLYLIDELKGGIIVIEEGEGKEITRISLEIMNNKTKVKPEYTDDDILMKIHIKTAVVIAEIGGEIDYIDKEKRDKLSNDTEKLIKGQIEDVIKKLQKDYESDIFGFGNILEIEKPDLWKTVEDDWDEAFSNLRTEINVEIEIKGSATRLKPIKVGK